MAARRASGQTRLTRLRLIATGSWFFGVLLGVSETELATARAREPVPRNQHRASLVSWNRTTSLAVSSEGSQRRPPMERWRSQTNLLNAMFGLLLFVSPWLLGFSGTAAWNAWISGAVLVAVSMTAI